MIILFKASAKGIKYCKTGKGNFSEGEIEAGLMEKFLEETKKEGTARAAGYLLYHGGEYIRRNILRLDKSGIQKAEKTLKYLPEHNALIVRLIKKAVKKLGEIPHFLFCDTAFFLNIPEKSAKYAVAHGLQEAEIRRFGSAGLYHQWVWNNFAEKISAGKIVSIRLDDYPCMAAISEGKAVETSTGFTPVEGLPSITSCGDVDPTIILQMHSAGISIPDINSLLAEKSGFSAYCGTKVKMSDVAKGKNKGPLREIFAYHLIKYTGAFVNIMGGVDAIVFTGTNLHQKESIIYEMCKHLDFIGLKDKIKEKAVCKTEEITRLTKSNSKVHVLCAEADRWKIMAELLKKEEDYTW